MKNITFGSARIRGTRDEIRMTIFIDNITAILSAGTSSENPDHSLIRLNCGLEIIIAISNDELLKTLESVYYIH
ncbi:hypothetical protein [Flavobacterium poyangense]|uniref:hypothetical protein n=1 Tax=Flavobacterium poyangense TaxID=2204302 RepID=UPI00141F01E6|nr:hypothetical protein [Flavobacterium sp. JXAS1]